jgi:DNA-binding NarL/FixJ family response regulator
VAVTSARVFIIDEHEPVRRALAERLSHADAFTVVGHTGGVSDVIDQFSKNAPDVVLIEIKRTDGMGIEILRQIADLPDAPKIVVLTSYPTAWEEKAARRAGASSYLLKDIDSEELIRHIQDVL